MSCGEESSICTNIALVDNVCHGTSHVEKMLYYNGQHTLSIYDFVVVDYKDQDFDCESMCDDKNWIDWHQSHIFRCFLILHVQSFVDKIKEYSYTYLWSRIMDPQYICIVVNSRKVPYASKNCWIYNMFDWEDLRHSSKARHW